MLIQQGTVDYIAVPFDNSGSPGSLTVYVLKGGGVLPLAGANLGISLGGPTTAFLQVQLSATDTDTLGDLVVVVNDGSANLGQRQCQVVKFSPNDGAGLGLTNLNATISSRGTANPGDPMNVTGGAKTDIANALLDLVDGVDAGVTLRMLLMVLQAFAAGQVTWDGANAGFLNWAGTKVRFTMPISGAGDRGPATFDFS